MERVKTGVAGFDSLIQGGIPRGFTILVTGQPGTGKSIFGLEHLYNGANSGENGVYVSLDTTSEQLKEQGAQFGWDFEKLEKENRVSILKVPPNRTEVDLFDVIKDEVKRINAKRLVFDSMEDFLINVSQFAIPLIFAEELSEERKDIWQRYNKLMESDQSKIREFGRSQGKSFNTAENIGNVASGMSDKRAVYLTIWQLKQLGTTNIIITSSGLGEQASIDGVSEYACDGVVVLGVQQIAKNAVRSIKISKMRNTKHPIDSFMLSFTDSGLSVTEEKVFSGSKISGINP